MNLDELQALLDTGDCVVQRESAQIAGVTATVAAAIADASRSQSPVRLVPRTSQAARIVPQAQGQPATFQEHLQEIEMAQKLGYLLCRCSWPPQIMVLTGADHVYRCRRCSRVRDM